MQFLIKKTTISETLALSEVKVSDDKDVAYTISKQIQHIMHNTIGSHLTTTTQVYTKVENEEWILTFTSHKENEYGKDEDDY